MKTIVNNARKTKKITFVTAIVFLGIAALWLILVTTLALINIDEVPDKFVIDFGSLVQELDYNEIYKEGYIIVSYVKSLELTVIFGFAGFALLLVSKINRDIEKEGPFGENFVKNVGKKLFGIFACAFGIILYNGIYQTLACEKLNYDFVAISGFISNSSFSFDFPLVAAVLVVASAKSTILRIFRYGAELQKQADETL